MGDRGEDYRQHRAAPDVLVPPPLLFGATWLLGLSLDMMTQATFGGVVAPILSDIGIVPLLMGAALLVIAVLQFLAAGTNVPTSQPVHVLVTKGLYGFSRNPIYVGLILLSIGFAMIWDAPVLLALTPLAVLVLRWGVIAREEDYLTKEFGPAYEAYREQVGRWFGRRRNGAALS